MNPLDHRAATLRCWEHTDCVEHPELALACALASHAEPPPLCIWDNSHSSDDGVGYGEGGFPNGGGAEPYGHGFGYGWFCGDTKGDGKGMGWFEGYSPGIPGDDQGERR